MGPVGCDMCGKIRGGPRLKLGALALCEHCADLFGTAPSAENTHLEPDSLAGLSVAKDVSGSTPENPHESERCTMAAPHHVVSERPTRPVPAPSLEELVRSLEVQFSPLEPETIHDPEPVEGLPTKLPPLRRSRHIDASIWGRGVMASAGITLAVMLAFLSSKASTPRAPSVPAALAREGSSSPLHPTPPTEPIARFRTLHSKDSPSQARPAYEATPTPSTVASAPAKAPVSAALPAANSRIATHPKADTRTKALPSANLATKGVSSEPVPSPDPEESGANPNASSNVPDFGGRD